MMKILDERSKSETTVRFCNNPLRYSAESQRSYNKAYSPFLHFPSWLTTWSGHDCCTHRRELPTLSRLADVGGFGAHRRGGQAGPQRGSLRGPAQALSLYLSSPP